MMNRFWGILFGLWLVLLPQLANAQYSTTYIILPFSYNEAQTGQTFGASQVLWCTRLAIPIGIIGATKLGFRITGVGVGANCGMAIYPDSDSGTAIATTGGLNCSSGGAKLATGLASFSLVPGVAYRVCACATTNGADYAASALSTKEATLENAFAVTVAAGANTCNATTGAPPSTTGSLAAANGTFKPPLLMGWAE